MGASSTRPEPECNLEQTNPTTTAAPCHCDYPKKLHLVLAFLAGILLAVLLMAIVLLVIKGYRKCHSSPQALDPHSDSPAEFLSIPDKAHTYASMDFKISEEMRDHCSANHPANANSVVYAEVVVTSAP